MGKTCTVKEKKVILQQQIPPRFPFEQRTRAELRFYRDIDYTKNALDYTQILTQLKTRGLLFKDEERAVEVLANISYFRIANYLRYFEIDNDRHLYKPDTYFEDAVYTTISTKNCVVFFSQQSKV